MERKLLRVLWLIALFHYLMLLFGVEGCGGECHLLCNAFFQPSLLKPIGLLSIYGTDKSSIKIIWSELKKIISFFTWLFLGSFFIHLLPEGSAPEVMQNSINFSYYHLNKFSKLSHDKSWFYSEKCIRIQFRKCWRRWNFLCFEYFLKIIFICNILFLIIVHIYIIIF